jgi:hypothetical protein
MITTPELAQTLSSKDSIGGYKHKNEQFTLNGRAPSYEARKTIGRGVGLFSTSEIQAGEIILTDPPKFIILRDALDALSQPERQEMQWRGVLQLSRDDQKLFRNLVRSKGGDEIDDILQTNSMGLSLGDKHGYLAVMPNAAVRNPSHLQSWL